MLSEPQELEGGVWLCHNEANESLIFAADGTLLEAYTQDGEPIAGVEGGRFAYGEGGQLLDLHVEGPTDEERVNAAAQAAVNAALEQRFGQQSVVNATPVAVETDADVLHRRWEADAEILESEYGRPLLAAERRRLANAALDDLDRGGSGSLIDASERLAWNGERTLSLDSDTDRQEYMARRLQEGEREARAEHYGDDDLQSDVEPPRQTHFNRDIDSERQEGMALEYAGHQNITFYDGGESAGPDEGFSGEES